MAAKAQRLDPARAIEKRQRDERAAKRAAGGAGKSPAASGTPAKRSSGAGRSGNPAKKDRVRVTPATFGDWMSGLRVRTLPLAIAPVILGAGIAQMLREFDLTLSILALIVALALQVGVNFANDYSDGIRGTDEFRVGPQRLTASGKARPRTVLIVALSWFGVAAVAGLVIVILSERWWLLAVGVVALLAAWFYTGGKKPYGYAGLGELMVFIFFGLVATVGTVYIQSDVIPQEAWLAGAAIGFLAVATLLANNIRDIPTDRLAGKHTLSVRIGDLASRVLYCIFMLLPFVCAIVFALFYPITVFVFFVLLAALPACAIMLLAKTPQELILVLKLTTLTALLYAIAQGAAIAF
ncbi:1,4-dihydroxy-2-naphthoate polyprenyltransferase [Klugiella xanthotipulae]|uniref:1,4-dihydroxy-2-naphthoate octaprenyltransferase n=1 Tax=Klugiella xanthotipulae TaxID=244735 RepID=A0A543HZ57_9MICO|nr:1,4-dihydroxy-2-naphthoate polyprenyltransferase [Klugiella xanthotipulae]TQM63634.1 1,4-dihydroxy-2-naphthoate prenyltransferase [Klugiella xanthotipulae]